MQASFTLKTRLPQKKHTTTGLYSRNTFPRWDYTCVHCVLVRAKLSIVEKHYLSNSTVSTFIFPGQNAARSTVPGGPSVACSTAKAVEWDAAWSKNLDPSGRAALGVHAAAYEESVDAKDANPLNGSPKNVREGIVEHTATVI